MGSLVEGEEGRRVGSEGRRWEGSLGAKGECSLHHHLGQWAVSSCQIGHHEGELQGHC